MAAISIQSAGVRLGPSNQHSNWTRFNESFMFQYQSRRPKQQNDSHVELIDLNTPAPVHFLFFCLQGFLRCRRKLRVVQLRRTVTVIITISVRTLMAADGFRQKIISPSLLVTNTGIHHETTVNTTDRLDVA